MEDSHGIGAAADTGDDGRRQPAFRFQDLLRASRPMTDWKSRTIVG